LRITSLYRFATEGLHATLLLKAYEAGVHSLAGWADSILSNTKTAAKGLTPSAAAFSYN